MLCDVGLFAEAERDGVLAALDTVEHEIESGSFDFQVNDEDIHTPSSVESPNSTRRRQDAHRPQPQ